MPTNHQKEELIRSIPVQRRYPTRAIWAAYLLKTANSCTPTSRLSVSPRPHLCAAALCQGQSIAEFTNRDAVSRVPVHVTCTHGCIFVSCHVSKSVSCPASNFSVTTDPIRIFQSRSKELQTSKTARNHSIILLQQMIVLQGGLTVGGEFVALELTEKSTI